MSSRCLIGMNKLTYSCSVPLDSSNSKLPFQACKDDTNNNLQKQIKIKTLKFDHKVNGSILFPRTGERVGTLLGNRGHASHFSELLTILAFSRSCIEQRNGWDTFKLPPIIILCDWFMWHPPRYIFFCHS